MIMTLWRTNRGDDFLGQWNYIWLRKTPDNTQEITWPTNNRIMESFLSKDDLSLFGQGPIRKNPITKEKEAGEEQFSPEMEAQIKEVF